MDDEKKAIKRIADRLDNAEALVVIELPASGSRRMHNRLSVSDEALLIETLRAAAR